MQKAVEACGGPADAVIVATDVIPAFTLAFGLVKKHGLYMVVGQPQEPIPVSFWDVSREMPSQDIADTNVLI